MTWDHDDDEKWNSWGRMRVFILYLVFSIFFLTRLAVGLSFSLQLAVSFDIVSGSFERCFYRAFCGNRGGDRIGSFSCLTVFSQQQIEDGRSS